MRWRASLKETMQTLHAAGRWSRPAKRTIYHVKPNPLTGERDIPVEVVREVVGFVKPPGVGPVKVSVEVVPRKGLSYSGLAFPLRVRGHRQIALMVAERWQYPCRSSVNRFSRRGRMMREFLADQVEALVAVTAHEMRHLWQGSAGTTTEVRVRRRRGLVWGARAALSELDCDAYGVRCLRRWRRRQQGVGQAARAWVGQGNGRRPR